MTVIEVLAWLDERAQNSTSFGSHCHAYELAARKLREAVENTDAPSLALTGKKLGGAA